jgi:hypothetical protein
MKTTTTSRTCSDWNPDTSVIQDNKSHGQVLDKVGKLEMTDDKSVFVWTGESRSKTGILKARKNTILFRWDYERSIVAEVLDAGQVDACRSLPVAPVIKKSIEWLNVMRKSARSH